jgi:hypothetical protein
VAVVRLSRLGTLLLLLRRRRLATRLCLQLQLYLHCLPTEQPPRSLRCSN